MSLYAVLSLVITILLDSLLINSNMSFFREPYAMAVYLEEGSALGWILVSGPVQYLVTEMIR